MSSRASKAVFAVVGMLHLSCQAILTAPAGTTMTLIVNPPFIEAHGGVAVVSAILTEAAGTPVADGTVVQFFTTLGRIEEQGRTNDGVARVNLVSDSRSGVANVTASSGAINTFDAPAEVQIGGVRPDQIVLTAVPQRIVESRSSQVVAIVLDENGNPVPNVPVFFSTTGATEFFDSGGQAVFTDNDGRARDVLRTRHPRDAPFRAVNITAKTTNDVEETITVFIN